MPKFDITCHGNGCLNQKSDYAPYLREYKGLFFRHTHLHDLTEIIYEYFCFLGISEWNHGRNHLLFEVSDWNFRRFFSGVAPFDTDQALVAKSGIDSRWYRPGFDFSIPLTNIQRIAPKNIGKQLRQICSSSSQQFCIHHFFIYFFGCSLILLIYVYIYI